MGLLWKANTLAEWGDVEYVGVNKPGPPLSERATTETNRDGIKPPRGFPSYVHLLLKPGDQYMSTSGYRILMRQWKGALRKKRLGEKSAHTYSLNAPVGTPGNANIWVGGREWHHDGGKVAPSHGFIWPDHWAMDVRGATEANAHTYVDASFFQGYAHDEWYSLVDYMVHDVYPKGHYELWGARCKTDKEFTRLVYAPNIGTTYSDFPDVYLLFGLYASTSLDHELRLRVAAASEHDTVEEAKAYILPTLEGSAVPPPPPDPTPDPPPVPPPARVTARCSVQAGAVLSPETGLRPQTEILSGLVDTVEYYLDSGKVAVSSAGPTYGAIIDIRSYAPGPHTFGFACFYKGQVVLDTYKAYPVTIVAPTPPPPVLTNRELADKAEAAFKATTISYPAWQKKVANGDYADVKTTKWWQGLDWLSKIT